MNLNIYYYHDIAFSIYDYFFFFIFLIGWFLRFWSIITLGEYFTTRLGVKLNHELIMSGPYRYLVHPSYIGEILALIGFYFYCQIYYQFTFLILAYHIFFNLKKMYNEELVMSKKFGNYYDRYVESKYRLIPFIY